MRQRVKEKSLEVFIRNALPFLSNKKIRRKLIDKIENWIVDIADKGYDRPRIVYEQRKELGIALLESFDRVFNSLAKNVKKKFFENFILNYALKGYEARRKFIEQEKIYPPGFITISPTNVCNLRCKGCYAGDIYKPETLDFEVFDWIIKEMKEEFGSYFIVISGGEPFMYKDKKTKKTLIDILEKHNDTYFMTYTNGTMINKDIAKKLAQLGNFSPAISVEGFEKETDDRRGKGVYKKIIRAMDNLKEEGVIFGISVTPTRYNADLLISDDFIDFFMKEKGAMYMWMFQYMPIGRNPSMDLLVTPEQRVKMYNKIWQKVRDEKLFIGEQRVKMYNKIWQKVRDEKLFIGDFWNSGMASDGCMSAARGGGYFYILWTGEITPCVFVPFKDKNNELNNVYNIYKNNKTLTDAINSDFFKAIRQWQDDYWRNKPAHKCGNLLMPCIIRDHSKEFENLAKEYAVPIDEGAKAYMGLIHAGKMPEYNKKLAELTDPMWKKELRK